MAKLKRAQKDHDRKVRQVTAAARARGRAQVRADLPGRPAPPNIAGYRPDVVWRKRNGGLAIREIDPPGPLNPHDQCQDRALREYARTRLRVDYRRLPYRR